jgi:UDPglucose 6-dehydrogenase
MDVTVVGLGKLGSPLAAVLASKGHNVIGVDLNAEFVSQINAGQAPVVEPQLQDLITAHRARLRATTDFNDAIPKSDISFIIVPTPSRPDGVFTNQYVIDAVKHIGAALSTTDRYHVVNITSTVMPGSTGGEIREALEKTSGRTVGRDVGLTYNPEFIALGSVVHDLLKPDMLLIGESDPRAGDTLSSVYASTVESNPPIQRMNWVNAEITKIAVNTYVTTKISYANMLAELCDRLAEADVDVVTSAIGKDSRIGTKYLKGALGYGGPCFPRDNKAFAALAHSLGAPADIAVATDVINRRQIDRVLQAVQGLAAKGAIVAVLGMSYKPNTPVVEESQGVMIAQRLASSGFQVVVYDPFALHNTTALLQDEAIPMQSASDAVRAADVVVIAVPSPEYADIPAEVYLEGGRRRTVLDCWRCTPPDLPNVADVVHLGMGKQQTQPRDTRTLRAVTG